MLSGEAANTNFIVFGLTRLWPKLTKNLLHRHRDFGQSYDDCSQTCGLWLKKYIWTQVKCYVRYSCKDVPSLIRSKCRIHKHERSNGSQSQIFLLLHPTIILVTNINLCFIYFWVQFCFVSFTSKISFLPPLPFVFSNSVIFSVMAMKWVLHIYVPIRRSDLLEYPILIEGT